ncbi:hypothetical protein BDR22DRAFT_824044 [Usnea florida]
MAANRGVHTLPRPQTAISKHKKHDYHYPHGVLSSKHHFHPTSSKPSLLHKTKKADYYYFVLRRESLITSPIYCKCRLGKCYTRLEGEAFASIQKKKQITRSPIYQQHHC